MPAETGFIDGAVAVWRVDRNDEPIEVSKCLVAEGIRALWQGHASRRVENQRELFNVFRQWAFEDLRQHHLFARAVGGADGERGAQMFTKLIGAVARRETAVHARVFRPG